MPSGAAGERHHSRRLRANPRDLGGLRWRYGVITVFRRNGAIALPTPRYPECFGERDASVLVDAKLWRDVVANIRGGRSRQCCLVDCRCQLAAASIANNLCTFATGRAGTCCTERTGNRYNVQGVVVRGRCSGRWQCRPGIDICHLRTVRRRHVSRLAGPAS